MICKLGFFFGFPVVYKKGKDFWVAFCAFQRTGYSNRLVELAIHMKKVDGWGHHIRWVQWIWLDLDGFGCFVPFFFYPKKSLFSFCWLFVVKAGIFWCRGLLHQPGREKRWQKQPTFLSGNTKSWWIFYLNGKKHKLFSSCLVFFRAIDSFCKPFSCCSAPGYFSREKSTTTGKYTPNNSCRVNGNQHAIVRISSAAAFQSLKRYSTGRCDPACETFYLALGKVDAQKLYPSH